MPREGLSPTEKLELSLGVIALKGALKLHRDFGEGICSVETLGKAQSHNETFTENQMLNHVRPQGRP